MLSNDSNDDDDDDDDGGDDGVHTTGCCDTRLSVHQDNHTNNIQLAEPTGYWIEKSDVRILPCLFHATSTSSTSRSDVVAFT